MRLAGRSGMCRLETQGSPQAEVLCTKGRGLMRLLSVFLKVFS